ncbi:MAG: SDR family oxidoreductase [Solirubrobacteraceae bacterium]|nr:SDR family oxidoreductase [Solirubrobacteraceae bacterium]
MSPTFDVRDKVALVTGAAQGIGYAVASELHARGAKVVLLDVNGERAQQAADRLESDRAVALAGDVRDRDRMTDVVAEVVARFGGLDVVVANAGVSPEPASIRTMDPDDFDRLVDINLRGVFNTVHPALDEIVARQGHVVLVASCAAFVPGPLGSSYMATKAAVEQLGRALRIELAAHGASAGVAYFGIVDTQMARSMFQDDPMGRVMLETMKWPMTAFQKEITPSDAGKVIVDGIAGRAPRTMAPRVWRGWWLLRGVVDPLADHLFAGDQRVRQMVRDVEARVGLREKV